MITIIHLITNFCISYHHKEKVTANKHHWTAGKFAVSMVDAMASNISPIFPKTMLKMACGSTIILVAFLGKLSLLIYYCSVGQINEVKGWSRMD